MRILHVIPSFVPAWGYGGPIYATFALTQKLAAYGQHVSVVTTNIDQKGTVDVPLERPVEMGGVKVWYFPIQIPRSYCYSSRLWHALREHVRNADVVHLHSIFLWPTSVAAYWARHLKIPYIVRPAGMLDPTCLTKKYDRRFRARLSWLKKTVFLKTIGATELSRAAGIHFTSYGEMNAAKRWHKNNGFVVPLGVDAINNDLVTGSQLQQQYPILKDKKVILFMSRLDRKKGLDLLIAGLRELAGLRRDFVFLLAGTGPYADDTFRLLKENGLWDNTIYLGFIQGEQKLAALRAANLFVLPSYQENFGFAVVEAIAAGVPVVISEGVDIHNEIEQAGAGRVTKLDPHDIACTLDDLLGNEALRKQMAVNAVSLARNVFNWDVVAADLISKYDQIVSTGHL